jgi:hypothetical protein
MRIRVVLASAALATASALAALSLSRASDHLDGPRATSDPPSDLTDVFAFTSPEDPTRVVLALAVTPYAGSAANGASFSPDVEYAFRVRRVAALEPLTLYATVLDVTCNFSGEDGSASTVTCVGPGGMQASASVGDTGGGSGAMRVFAGLRSDPAFFDRQGALATLATGRTSFTGQNAFAGANVLAIVVELPSSTFLFVPDAGAKEAGTTDAGPPPDAGPVYPVLSVSAETVRRGS